MDTSKTYSYLHTVKNNIALGKNFSQKVFARFWNHKEAFFDGMVKNPCILDYDSDRSKFKSWWNEWRYDDKFVQDLFIAIMANYEDQIVCHMPRLFFHTLPKSVALNPLMLNLCLDYYGVPFRAYDEVNGKYINDRGWEDDYILSFEEANESIELPPKKGHELFLRRPDIALELLKNKVIRPDSIPFALRRADKAICAVLVGQFHHRAGVPVALFDDPSFILDCLQYKAWNSTEQFVRARMTRRLRGIVDGFEIKPALETYIMKCELERELNKDKNGTKAKVLKV
jgi:hypothetical protein